MAAPATIHFVTPTFRPAGGVVKIFDYLVHALDLGYEAEVHCPQRPSDEEPLFSIPRFSRLRSDARVRFHDQLSFGINFDHWVLFSWPPHYEEIARRMAPGTAHERVIHLVQNTRHANPAFTDGYALRLLARPLARIMVSHEVMDACLPHLNPHSASRTIVEAHDWRFFHKLRSGGLPDRVRVAYTTWKSDLGDRVQRAVGENGLAGRFAFDCVGGPSSWEEIRELLHGCDVFLCCPNPEEGFYLPGLEALAAGAIVITPDVGGNQAYSKFDENCLLVDYDDVDTYVSALSRLADFDAGQVESLREKGYAVLAEHTLNREREQFADFLLELSGRCAGA